MGALSNGCNAVYYGVPRYEKMGDKNFGGVALFQSRVLVATPSENLLRLYLDLVKVF